MAAAVLGMVLCMVAGMIRIFGEFSLLNFEMITIFQGGVGLMVAACVLKLYSPFRE